MVCLRIAAWILENIIVFEVHSKNALACHGPTIITGMYPSVMLVGLDLASGDWMLDECDNVEGRYADVAVGHTWHCWLLVLLGVRGDGLMMANCEQTRQT